MKLASVLLGSLLLMAVFPFPQGTSYYSEPRRNDLSFGGQNSSEESSSSSSEEDFFRELDNALDTADNFVYRLQRDLFLAVVLQQPKCTAALTEKSTLPHSCGARYAGPSSFMTEAEELLERQCDLVDPLRDLGNKHRLLPDQQVDFVVIGSGTAGSIVAGRLAMEPNNWDVALLEAGGPYPTGVMIPGTYFSYAKEDSPINWNFAVEPQEYACRGYKNGQCHFPRGKAMGGTGVLHGMMYMRGNPYDYSKWPGTANVSWDYESVLPYFMKSERNTQVGDIYEKEYHGTSGPVTVAQFPDHPKIAYRLLEAGSQMQYNTGRDLNGRNQLGFTLAQATQHRGSRLSLYNAFIVPLLGKKRNLFISPNSYVTKVLIDNNRAYGVEYYKNGYLQRVLARKEVIISGGTIQSPQILLLSGIGPKTHLAEKNITVIKDLPRVGENLQNHVSFSVRFEVRQNCYIDRLSKDSVYQYLMEREGPLTSTGLSQVTGFIRVNRSDGVPEEVPDMQMFFEGYLANCSLDGEGLCRNAQRFITMTPTLLRPTSRGTIKLRSSNPTDPPVINPNYLSYEEERKTLVSGIKFALDMSRTPALRRILKLSQIPVPECKDEFGSDDYWKCAIQYSNNPENHQTGTCSMGKSEEDSVVDPTLKVHGIEGLRVIDASAIPHVTSGNVNAPIMMVAERGADFITKEWSMKNQQ